MRRKLITGKVQKKPHDAPGTEEKVYRKVFKKLSNKADNGKLNYGSNYEGDPFLKPEAMRHVFYIIQFFAFLFELRAAAGLTALTTLPIHTILGSSGLLAIYGAIRLRALTVMHRINEK